MRAAGDDRRRCCRGRQIRKAGSGARECAAITAAPVPGCRKRARVGRKATVKAIHGKAQPEGWQLSRTTVRSNERSKAPAGSVRGDRTGTERCYLSGPEALVSLLRLQARQDRCHGLDTAGFVSGYRGSPLGGLDFALWRDRGALEALDIRFQPGLNEELAVNAVWGSQQIDIFGGGPHRGVFGLWYAKNPGLDRAADAIKHANFDGAHPFGGVLAVVGDDPAAASSSMPNQCEQAFMAAAIPVIYPADIGEILEFGLKGYALSRFSGLWVGMKMVADIAGTSASVTMPQLPVSIATPEDFPLPEGGLGPRWPNTRWQLDALLQEYKLPSVAAFARANAFDRTEIMPRRKRLGLIASGRLYGDLREALALLGLSDADLAELGVGFRKLGLIWPIEDVANAEFMRGFEEILVIEEKRAVIETQVKELAFSWPDRERPQIVGKRDETGHRLVPTVGEPGSLLLARIIAERLLRLPDLPASLADRLRNRLAEESARAETDTRLPKRLPHYCAGCPHARSTRLPEGDLAMAGIGCHTMAMWLPQYSTATIAQMGGEGANWIGISGFANRKHVFQNLGDGTFTHSGILAIRAAVAAGVSITYKILVNGAVAMTGGQPVEGAPDVADMAWQLHAEGVAPIYLASGRSAVPPTRGQLPQGTRLVSRDDMDRVMRECRQASGVSAIIYDQICATEKRRAIRSGRWHDREPVVVINDRVCENCGDCSEKSHCIAVRRHDTRFGVKRRIDLSTCNTDLSCIDGFCPSFVTLENAKRPEARVLREPPAALLDGLPDPEPAPCDRPHATVIAGVGGTGLVTLATILGHAAHIEGKSVSVLDSTGLARKGGEVTSHIRIARRSPGWTAYRIPDGGADLLIAGDLATAAGAEGVVKLKPQGSAVVLDDAVPMVEQAFDPAAPLPLESYRRCIASALAGGHADFLDSGKIAMRALGETIFANVMLLGYAAQKGYLPVTIASLHAAIATLDVAGRKNRAALDWGRLMAARGDRVLAELGLSKEGPSTETLREKITSRAAELADYQDSALANRYLRIVEIAEKAETAANGSPGAFTEGVARTAYHLMACKDEYEVARLLSAPDFIDALRQGWGAEARLHFHLAPPFLPLRMTSDGRGGKWRFGSWILPVLRVIASARRLRGSWLDPFLLQAERRLERALVGAYEEMVNEIARRLNRRNLDAATALVETPLLIRGFGPVKQRALARTSAELARRLSDFEAMTDGEGAADWQGDHIGAGLARLIDPAAALQKA